MGETGVALTERARLAQVDCQIFLGEQAAAHGLARMGQYLANGPR